MVFSIDFLGDGRVLEWEATNDGATVTEHDDYTPRFYVTARDPNTEISHNRRRVCSGFREIEIVSTRTAYSRGFALLTLLPESFPGLLAEYPVAC